MASLFLQLELLKDLKLISFRFARPTKSKDPLLQNKQGNMDMFDTNCQCYRNPSEGVPTNGEMALTFFYASVPID